MSLVELDQLNRIEYQLKRLADAVEGLLESTDPLRPLVALEQLGEEKDKERVFYSNETDEIIREQLRRRGKEPK